MDGMILGGPIDTTIKVGDRVKCYDFPDTTPERLELCYKIGTVEAIEPMDGCDRYKVKVEKIIFRGVEDEKIHVDYVYPPVNGTPTFRERVCNGVVKISQFRPATSASGERINLIQNHVLSENEPPKTGVVILAFVVGGIWSVVRWSSSKQSWVHNDDSSEYRLAIHRWAQLE